MAISTKRIVASIEITGQSQEETTEEIMGFIDQIIISSSTTGQSFDLVMLNEDGEEVYRNDGVTVSQVRSDIRPRLLPRSAVTIRIENPVNVEGTISLTIIEQTNV